MDKDRADWGIIKQLRDNFKIQFKDYSIKKDMVAFVFDPLTV